MKLTVKPGYPLKGEIRLAGDKSISHRAALFGAIAQGESRFENFLVAGVTKAMLDALRFLNVEWKLEGSTLTILGNGIEGLNIPSSEIDCGNSGTTMRLLAGALTAANIPAILTGSEGLCHRPMMRIVDPLRAAGAMIEATPEGTAPLILQKRSPKQSISGEMHSLAIASAQVKTAILLAALAGNSPTLVVEPALSRDHTERMLSAMGVEIEEAMVNGTHTVRLSPPKDGNLAPLTIRIPGDFSSAAFLIVAALITPASDILIKDVGLNPTRTGLLDILLSMGADIQILNHQEIGQEPVGDLHVRHSQLQGARISGDQVVKMIDEIPVFAIAGAYAVGETQVTEAEELRYKESDRISSICAMLQKTGVNIEEQMDGFMITNHENPLGGVMEPHSDHRLAMSLAVSGLAARGTTTINEAEIFMESYPQFVEDLRSLGADISYE